MAGKKDIRKVLIVDDDKNFLLSLKDGLSKFKDEFQVLLAYNGEEALSILEKEKVSLIISDLKMEEIDGLELMSLVAQKYPFIPFILMTAYGSPPIKSKAEELGAVQYIEKPITLEQIVEAIRTGFKVQIPGKEQLRFFSLSSLTQLIGLEGKDCTLIISEENSEKKGALYFKRGKLIHAITQDLEGEEAGREIFLWENVKVSILHECPLEKGTIEKKLEAFILEAMKEKDELSGVSDETLPSEATTINKTTKKEVKMVTKYDELIAGFKEIPGYKGVAIFTVNGETLAFHASDNQEKVKNLFLHMSSLFVQGEKAHNKADAGVMDFIQTDSDMGKLIARKGEKYIIMTLLEDDGNLALAKEQLEEIANKL